VRSATAVFPLACALACNVPQLVAPDPVTPTFSQFGAGTCKASTGATRPLVIEWPSTDRASLEASSHRGVVVVKVSPCDIEVLRCRAPGGYAYTPITPKSERLKINNDDDLYANLPVGAAKLSAKLQSTGRMDVDMTIVGELAADHPDVRRDELTGGDCESATHVIVGMTLGAFEFSASGAKTQTASAEVVIAGGGASHNASREVLARDGETSSCNAGSSADKAPPQSCGGTLRIEVASIQAAAPPLIVAVGGDSPLARSPGSPANVTCPLGTSWNGSDCVLPSSSDSGGSHFVPTQATVIDSATSLMWQRRHPMTKIPWKSAEKYCRTLPVAGGGWRLPTVKELTSIVGQSIFAEQDSGQREQPFFWTSARSDQDSVRATMLRTSDGFSRLYFMEYEAEVRCVRSPLGL
jgi:hypothetical protein